MWTTIALLTALSATPAQADLSLTHVRSTHGLLGPQRDNDTLSPGENWFLSFDIEGVQVDAEGKVTYRMAIEVRDSSGKVLFKQEPKDTEAKTSLGGNRVPAYATLTVGLDQPAGDYQLKIIVNDRASGKEASLTRDFKVLPRSFALVRLATSVDVDGRYPAGVFATGQGVWVHCSAVGFQRDRVGKQPNIVFTMRVLDESGKPTLATPTSSAVNKDIPDKLTGVPMAFPLILNRPGKFTVELQAVDQVGGRKARATFAIAVQTPQK